MLVGLTAATLGCSGPIVTPPPATPSPVAPTATPTLAPTPTPPSVTINSTETVGGVTVQDITFNPTYAPAYLVFPSSAAAGSLAGILWFHWLETGAPNSNRTEFLDEAKALAGRGVVSVLVDGSFPWHQDPESIVHDTSALEGDLAMLREAYSVLLARPEVDPARTALVGHDFGSMYQSVLFAQDSRPAALVMMAPTARWADWFYRYWVISDDEAAYKAALAPYDPVTTLANAGGRPVLLQFATNDRFIPSDVAAEITAAAGTSAETKSYDAGHELDEAAMADRDAWLALTLGLKPAT